MEHEDSTEDDEEALNEIFGNLGETFKSGKSVRRILRNSWMTYPGETSVGNDDLAYIDLLYAA